MVYVEGAKLCDCYTFVQAYTALDGSFYVFKLVYPKCWEKTLALFQNIIMVLKNCQGQITLDKRILTVLTSINEQLA